MRVLQTDAIVLQTQNSCMFLFLSCQVPLRFMNPAGCLNGSSFKSVKWMNNSQMRFWQAARCVQEARCKQAVAYYRCLIKHIYSNDHNCNKISHFSEQEKTGYSTQHCKESARQWIILQSFDHNVGEHSNSRINSRRKCSKLGLLVNVHA